MQYYVVRAELHPFGSLNPVSDEQDAICRMLWEPDPVASRWKPPIVKAVFDRKDDQGRRIKPTWGDCMDIVSHGLALNEHAAQVLRPFFESAAELLPLTIRPRAPEPYHALHVMPEAPGAITSEWVRKGPGTYNFGTIETWHVSGETPNLDVFRIPKGPRRCVYCSQRFMDAVNAYELTGFRFSELIVKVDPQDDGKASMA